MRRLAQWLQGDARDGPPATEASTLQVLMVCMGNICRSPIAEGVLRAKLDRAGLAGRIAVDSAGTHGYHTGEAPDRRAIRQAALRGYDISGLRARPVAAEDFQRFDWLLAMDAANLDWLQQRQPAQSRARLDLLMAHATKHPHALQVPDPYYGPAAGFDQVLDLVEDACDGLVDRLRGDLGAGNA